MILNFIFSNLNTITLGIWIIFSLIIMVRFFRPAWVKNISYKKLLIYVIALKIVQFLFITWGQYYVWSSSTDFTRTLLDLPLSKEVPMPFLMEWLRPIMFENNLGYFLYYVWGRFWLYVFILFLLSLVVYILLRIWRDFRGGFSKDGPLLILILSLISGWPGVLVFIPLGFILAVLHLAIAYIRGKKNTEIELVFLFACFVALVFGDKILGLL
ncbi:MAG: hypothetical protein WCG45_00840 [bacterium]